MSDRHDLLIDRLTSDLHPTSKWSQRRRLLLWMAIVGVFAVATLPFADFVALQERVAHERSLLLAAIGAAATALLGAVATFQLSRPHSRRWWGLLPLPALLLWVGASGLGCLQTASAPAASAGTHAISMAESEHCLAFFVGMSLPIGAALFVLLKGAVPASPQLLTLTAGLTIGATAASLLALIHPYDAAALDLAIHILGIALVIGCVRLWGMRTFAGQSFGAM